MRMFILAAVMAGVALPATIVTAAHADSVVVVKHDRDHRDWHRHHDRHIVIERDHHDRDHHDHDHHD